MRPSTVLPARLTALSLLVVLILMGLPPVAPGVRARSSPGGGITAYLPGASAQPRAGRGPAPRQPGLPVRLNVHLSAVDYADHRLRYRLVGDVVQRSTNGGRQWAAILTPGTSGFRRGG